ncbi:pectate lyase [Pseudoxanthomonas sp. UTMC 1351]|uniref:pectate lyase n=1 Tax=Pseudoxanthomonas sp. UTMC 1351 TaxID=2695853 RepID=UPI0034CE678C
MISSRRLAVALLATAMAAAIPVCAQSSPAAAPVLDGFEDAMHHWQNTHGDDYPRYAPEQVAQIADNILRYQRKDGGWIQNQDPARILDAAGLAQYAQEAAKTGGSFDNRNIYTHVDYLAGAYAQTGDARYRDASVRGLEFILAHQNPRCGGWPHSVPGSESYHPFITIADDVTAGVLGTLRAAASDAPRFDFIEAPLRERIRKAVVDGDACLLQLQVRQGQTLAGWAGQYDDQTLQPTHGRRFELPAMATQETVGVVRYLISIPNPSPEVVAAIEGAVAWLQRVKLEGWRIETFEAEPEQYRYHASKTDRRLVRDASASNLWARFYDLSDNTVVLATRDGVRVKDYAEIPRERRTGYEWYGQWPKQLLSKDYPNWKARLAH